MRQFSELTGYDAVISCCRILYIDSLSVEQAPASADLGTSADLYIQFRAIIPYFFTCRNFLLVWICDD
jgi:hypothetical protein